jgi:hypothetical protein
MKLSRPQRDVLTRVADGGVLIVRFERSGADVRQVCRLGGLEPHPMTVNALIVAGLLAPQDDVRDTSGRRTISYAVSYAGRAALDGA